MPIKDVRPGPGRVLFLVTALAVTVAPEPAGAVATVAPACGDTVTRSVTLRTDLRCRGDGLIVGAPGVVLNLNGHTISGSGRDVGVRVVERAGVKIHNGTIRNFFRGVALEGTGNTSIGDVRFVDNGVPDASLGGAAVYADQVAGLTVRGGQVVGLIAVPAVRAEASTGVVVRGVDVTGIIDLSIDTSSAQVVGNTLRGGAIRLSESNGTVVRGNTLNQAGIRISESNNVTVRDNRIAGGQIQLAHASENVLVQGNTLRASEFGLSVVPPVPGLRIVANTFSGHSYGIHLRPEFLTQLDRLEVAHNTFTGNEHAGLFLEAPERGPGPARLTLAGNRFVRNGYASAQTDSAGRPIDDGLHTNLPVGQNVLVTRNHTVDNADYGIEALPVGSVRDGGGNVSDGDRRGCAGVVCR